MSLKLMIPFFKIKRDNDKKFTIQDMIKIYYGESYYAKYDNSACQ